MLFFSSLLLSLWMGTLLRVYFFSLLLLVLSFLSGGLHIFCRISPFTSSFSRLPSFAFGLKKGVCFLTSLESVVKPKFVCYGSVLVG